MSDALKIERVLFPTDFSEHSEEALAQAAEIAHRFGAELLMLHVAPERRFESLDWGEMPTSEELEQAFEREATRRITALEQRPRVTVRQILMRGSPAETIREVAEAERADLIVMATHGRRGLEHLVLGSVTEDVMRSASCDVMTLRRREHGTTFGRLERILVPVDFSDHSLGALRTAHAIARACGASIQLLHVIPPTSYPSFYPPSATHALEQNVDALRDQSRLKLEEVFAELEPTGPLVEHSTHAVFGNPATEILELSRQGADLIVMGNHGRSAIEHMLLGSVTERVLHRADRPVWVSRSHREPRAEKGEELARALKDPTSVFDRPREVLDRLHWSTAQRRRVLEQWRLDAERLSSSADENMGGGEPARLREVELALEQLAT